MMKNKKNLRNNLSEDLDAWSIQKTGKLLDDESKSALANELILISVLAVMRRE